MEECVDGDKPGEFTCQCREGFEISQRGRCEGIKQLLVTCYFDKLLTASFMAKLVSFSDKNECVNGESNCHQDATCHNSIGSYSCVCGAGFKQFNNGRLCVNEKEKGGKSHAYFVRKSSVRPEFAMQYYQQHQAFHSVI